MTAAPCRCPIGSHTCEPAPPEPEQYTDAEEAYLDNTVRWHHPTGYRGEDPEYL